MFASTIFWNPFFLLSSLVHPHAGQLDRGLDLFLGLLNLIPVTHPHLQCSMFIFNSEGTGPLSGIDISQAENLNGRRWSKSI